MKKQDDSHIRRLRKLYELSMTLSGDPLEVFKNAAYMIGELFNVRVVCLSEIRGDELYFISVYIDGKIVTDAGRCHISITPCSTVEQTKDIRIFDNVAEMFPEASFLKTHNAFSCCGFPALDSNGEVIAVTCLLDDKPHDFSKEDQELLRIFGQRIGFEMERQKDITERKREVDALRNSEAFNRTIIASISMNMFLKDRSCRYLMVNGRHAASLGLSPDDFVGKSDHDFFPPDIADSFQTDDRAVMESLEIKAIEERYFSEGQYRWAHTIKSPILDSKGDAIGVLGFFDDITERKQAEKEVESLAKFPSENPNPILRISSDNTILYKNDAVNKLLKEEGLSKSDKDIYKILPDNLKTLIKQALEKRQSSFMKEVKVGKKVFSYNIIPILEGKYVNLYGRNITERKNLEEQLRQSQKMETVGQLAGGVAHDFNNILGAIMNYGYILKNNLENEKQKELLKHMLESTDKAAKLTSDLLAFSRKQMIQTTPVNLNEIIKRVEKLISRIIGEHIEINTILVEKAPVVMADSAQIEQVLRI